MLRDLYLLNVVWREQRIAKQKRLVRRAVKHLKRQNLPVVLPQDLYRDIFPGQYGVCHVIGSGWSLVDSMHSIRDHDFVIGINFSGLADLKNDVYFVEFGGYSVRDISDAQVKVVEDLVAPYCKNILFKNLWEPKNDTKYITSKWGHIVSFIPDFSIPLLSSSHFRSTVDKVLVKDLFYLRQLKSSVITAVAFAANAGFKDIVLHGLDFGGPYFFDKPEFRHQSSYRPPAKKTSSLYSVRNKQTSHPTSSSSRGLAAVLPVVRDTLEERGITIYAAHASSPSAKILKIY